MKMEEILNPESFWQVVGSSPTPTTLVHYPQYSATNAGVSRCGKEGRHVTSAGFAAGGSAANEDQVGRAPSPSTEVLRFDPIKKDPFSSCVLCAQITARKNVLNSMLLLS